MRKIAVGFFTLCLALTFALKANADNSTTTGGNSQGNAEAQQLRQEIQALRQQAEPLRQQLQETRAKAEGLRDQLRPIVEKIKADREKLEAMHGGHRENRGQGWQQQQGQGQQSQQPVLPAPKQQ